MKYGKYNNTLKFVPAKNASTGRVNAPFSSNVRFLRTAGEAWVNTYFLHYLQLGF